MTVTSDTAAVGEALREQLEPVRAALLDDARTQASMLLSGASADADAIIAEAGAGIDREIRRAEARARATSLARRDQRLDRTRAEAHQRLLRTRAAIADRLATATRRAALHLRDDVRYPALLDHFEGLARQQLGVGVAIERDPPGLGGIIARCGNRRVDYTLASLADRTLDRLDDDIGGGAWNGSAEQ